MKTINYQFKGEMKIYAECVQFLMNINIQSEQLYYLIQLYHSNDVYELNNNNSTFNEYEGDKNRITLIIEKTLHHTLLNQVIEIELPSIDEEYMVKLVVYEYDNIMKKK